VNAKQRRTETRVDPHARCREDFTRVQAWLTAANNVNNRYRLEIVTLTKELRLWRIAAVGMALVTSVFYGFWLLTSHLP